MALLEQLQAPDVFLHELVRCEQPRVHAEPQHPRDDPARARVVGDEQPVPVLGRGEVELGVRLAGVADMAVAPEVALHLPCDALGDEDRRRAEPLAQLPVGARGVLARVEVLGPVEVVLGLRRV